MSKDEKRQFWNLQKAAKRRGLKLQKAGERFEMLGDGGDHGVMAFRDLGEVRMAIEARAIPQASLSLG